MFCSAGGCNHFEPNEWCPFLSFETSEALLPHANHSPNTLFCQELLGMFLWCRTKLFQQQWQIIEAFRAGAHMMHALALQDAKQATQFLYLHGENEKTATELERKKKSSFASSFRDQVMVKVQWLVDRRATFEMDVQKKKRKSSKHQGDLPDLSSSPSPSDRHGNEF